MYSDKFEWKATFQTTVYTVCQFTCKYCNKLNVCIHCYLFLNIFVYFYVNLLFSPKGVDLEKEFEENTVNSAVFLLCLTMQITNFIVNYHVSYCLQLLLFTLMIVLKSLIQGIFNEYIFSFPGETIYEQFTRK